MSRTRTTALKFLFAATSSGVFIVASHGHAASDPHAPCNTKPKPGPMAHLVVRERTGPEGLSFDLNRDQVEQLFGPPEGGSENYIEYESSGIQICFCGNGIKDIHFLEAFRGRLAGSGLGIGHDLEAVIAAYGELLDEKVVDSVCSWQLDRVLLVRASPDATDEPAYKLFYYDLGLFFLFDEDETIIEFGVFPPVKK